jgi:hypothetical protein
LPMLVPGHYYRSSPRKRGSRDVAECPLDSRLRGNERVGDGIEITQELKADG